MNVVKNSAFSMISMSGSGEISGNQQYVLQDNDGPETSSLLESNQNWDHRL
jgi:hypothetical protein